MKVRVKLTLWVLGLFSLLLGAGGSLLMGLSFHSALEREKDMAYGAFQLTLQALSLAGGGTAAAETLEQLFEQNPALGAAFRLEDGEQIAQGGTASVAFPTARPEAGTCLFQLTAGGPGGRCLVLSGQTGTGLLQVARDVSPLYDQRAAQQRAYLAVFLGMSALGGGLSYALARVLTAPLEDLSRATRAVAGGELSARVRVASRDEVGAVAADFNAMAARLEASVAALKGEVRRTEDFMGAFSHELKTPMTSIIGYADLIRGGTLTGEEEAEAAHYIFSEGRRLERLSRKMLALLEVRREGLALTPAAPAALVGELLDRLEPEYRARGIALTGRCQPGECLLEPDLFRSLALNLLDNAAKAMEGGGRITVESEMTGEGCRLRVLDQGRGIPPEALARLTEAFYRVDPARSRAQGGAGLGLALCRKIVDLHGGSLTIENRPQGGVVVTVELKGGRG